MIPEPITNAQALPQSTARRRSGILEQEPENVIHGTRNRPGPFAGKDESYPVGDKKHVKLALSGLSHAINAHTIQPGAAAKVRAKIHSQAAKLGVQVSGGK